MDRRQFLAIFLCSFVLWTVGGGLAPLLPLYATNLGASPSQAGCQLALSYAALAVGTLAAGWLPSRLQRRRTLITVWGGLSIPLLWLTGKVQDPWALAAALSAWCLGAGMSLASVSVLAALGAADGSRGRVFGALSLNAGLGALLGGVVMGPVAERWGYPALFGGLALFSLLWPAAGLLLKDSGRHGAEPLHAKAARPAAGLGRPFYCLLLGGLAATLAAYLFIAGRSLVMAGLGFGASAISGVSGLSELPILPLPLVLGRLSDRFGRRPFLALGYLAAAGGLAGLTVSASAWHFYLSSVLVTASLTSGAVGTALVTDVVPREALSRGLSLWGAATGIAGILGSAGSGYAVQHLGPTVTFVSGALLPLAALALLFAARRPGRQRSSAPQSSPDASFAKPLPATT